MDWDTFETDTLTKCATIQASLDRRLDEFRQVLSSGQAAYAQNKTNTADLSAISFGETPFHNAQEYLGGAHLQLVLLGHDIEIAVADSFIDKNIDLGAVVPPIDIHLDPHNTVAVRQINRAQVIRGNSPPCKCLPSSDLALNVPMEVTALGQSARPDLFISLQPARVPNQPAWQRKFLLLPSRGPMLCPPDAVKQLISGQTIDGRVRTEALSQTSGLAPFDVDATFIDQTFGPSFLYAALATNNLSFFGVAHRRKRHSVPALGNLPNWSTAGLKIHEKLLQAKVASQLPSGAFLTQFGADPGAQVFRFAIAMEREESRGGDLFKVTVRIRVTGNFVLSIQAINPDRLQINSIQQGNLQIARVKVDVDVFNTKVPLPGLDGVVDDLATAIAQALSGDLGNYSTRIDERVSNCQQISSEVIPECLAVFIRTF